MVIYNSTDFDLQLDVSDNPVIKPGEKYEYASTVFDTINIQSNDRRCTIIREYSDYTVENQWGLNAEVDFDNDHEIVITSRDTKAVILVSGGLDSAVTLAHAVSEYGAENVVAASITYGQAHVRETLCAEKIAEYFGVRLIKEDISSFFEYAKNVSSLMQGSDIEISDKNYAEQIKAEGKPATEVPLRNGAFLMAAASLAMSIFPDEDVAIGLGAHADDAAGNAYPDCTPEFAAAMDEAIRIGSRDHLHVERPLIHLTKAGVVALGLQLRAPFHLTTSCYRGGDEACNHCGTCLDRVAAFKENGVVDPIKYAEPIDWSDCKKIEYLADVYPEE